MIKIVLTRPQLVGNVNQNKGDVIDVSDAVAKKKITDGGAIRYTGKVAETATVKTRLETRNAK
jgi:hypothetical protein